MSKHRVLNDFVKLLRLLSDRIKDMEIANGRLQYWDILKLFTESDNEFAKRFSYVLGGMLGSEKDQYDLMLSRLRKRGQLTIATELYRRRAKPCIDIQDAMFMLNSDSTRNRTRSYGYSDYGDFAERQFISGSATSFNIDWHVLDLGDLH